MEQTIKHLISSGSSCNQTSLCTEILMVLLLTDIDDGGCIRAIQVIYIIPIVEHG